MAEDKITSSTKANTSGDEKVVTESKVAETGEFDGEVRYDGTVLVDREIDGEVVSVLTDKPRKGDKVQAHEFNDSKDGLQQSTKESDAGSATPPKR